MPLALKAVRKGGRVVCAGIHVVLHRARLGPVPAVFLAVALALTVILSVGGLIGMQMSEVIFDIPGYAATIDQKGFRDQTLEILEIALI